MMEDVEGLLRAHTRRHAQRTVVLTACERWARHHHLRDYVGLRYPPCFAAAIGEALACVLVARYPSEAASVEWDTERLAAAQLDSAAHPWQVYGAWLLLGLSERPTLAAVTSGWDTDDHLALEACEHRVTRALRARWQPKLAAISVLSKHPRDGDGPGPV